MNAVSELMPAMPDIDLGKLAVFADIAGILEGMLADWGLSPPGGLAPTTRLLADLDFASLDAIHLAAAIESHYARPRMNFQDLLLKDGRYVPDVTVQQLVDFVAGKLVEPRT